MVPSYPPWYICTLPTQGIPCTPPAHSRCVYTEHAGVGLTALDQEVTEQTIPVTVIYRQAGYRRYCSSSVLFIVENVREAHLRALG